MIVTEDLYKTTKDCCGCESCVSACPKGIIRMKAAYDGFLYPEAFNPSECIDCRKCLKVCPLKISYKGAPAISHYGGYDTSQNAVKASASGGLATSISRHFIHQGGIVYGVRYDSSFQGAIFTRCDSSDELEALRGSKYIQASKGEVYRLIRQDLRSRKVLLIALPCEVHAARILFNDFPTFYTAALVCHGPTSPLVQKEYAAILKGEFSSQITSFTVRHKYTGWKPYYIKADFANGTSFKEEFHSGLYGIAFRELKRPSCSTCPFKLNYQYSTIDADIILGDFHGVTPSETAGNSWGVSQASVLTEKGNELLQSISDDFTLFPITPRKAIHYNKALARVIKPRWNRNRFAHAISEKGLAEACRLKSVAMIDAIEKFKGTVLRFMAKTAKAILRR